MSADRTPRRRTPAATRPGPARRTARSPAATNEPFAARRGRLAQALTGNAAAIFVAGTEARRNGDVDHEFRQLSTFHYLTGFPEPDAVAVLRPGQPDPYVLFVRPFDATMAVWVGPRAGVEGARRHFGANAAYPIEELEQRLPELLAPCDTLYWSLGAEERMDRLVARIVAQRRGAAQRGAVPLAQVRDPFPLVAQQRLIKSADEVASLQRAIDVTGAGIEAAIAAARPGMHEYEVQAVLEAEYRRLGSPRNGFPSIVAAGANACTLHYTSNTARIGARELLLLDTGAEWDYYSADVTRTFPPSGRFTPEQRAVYDIVLEAQQRAMDLIRPGVRFHDVHDRALRVLVDGLRHLGVLRGQTAALTRRGAYAPYFMHGTSHWLGLDVHDAGDYREGNSSMRLRAGMVLTVEPGLYLAPGSGVPRALEGIGVRIEDDVLVTRGGHRNLSAGIPRDAETLEAMAGGRS